MHEIAIAAGMMVESDARWATLAIATLEPAAALSAVSVGSLLALARRRRL